MQTIKRNGETYILVPRAAWQKIASGRVRLPPMPPTNSSGNVPAIEFARATIARGLIRDRTAAGLSQAALARLSGVRVETLNRIEKAKVTADPSTIAKLDRALETALKPATRRVGRVKAE